MESYKLYKGEIELCFDSQKHIYTANGKYAEGVTNVTSVVDRSAPLMFWAVKQTLGVIEERVKPGAMLDELEIRQMLDDASYAHRKSSKGAASLGTMAHEWAEKELKGLKPETPTNQILKNLTDSFLAWKEQNEVRVIASERKIYSRKYGYAGTTDIIAEVRGMPCIVDIKTSNGIYFEMLLQTVAYQQAVQEEDGIDYYGRWIVRLGKELKNGQPDFEAKLFQDFSKDFKGFLGALVVKRRMTELERQKKQETLW